MNTLAFAAAAPTAIVDGQIIDGTGTPPIADGVVLIANRRIAAVSAKDSVKIPPDAHVVHAGGMTVMPGVIGMHVHLSVIASRDGTRFVHDYLDRQEREIMPAEWLHLSARVLAPAAIDVC